MIDIFSIVKGIGELIVDANIISEEDYVEIESCRRDFFISMKFKSYHQAEQVLNNTIRHYPFYFPLYLARSELFIVMKRYEEALDELNKYIVETQSFKAFILKFYCLYKLKRASMSIEYLKRAYNLTENSEHKEKMIEWQALIDTDIQDEDIWEEMRLCQDSEEIDTLSQTIYDIGIKFSKEQRYDLASTSFMKIINYIDSNHIQALYECANIWSEAEKYYMAIDYYLHVYLIKPDYKNTLECIADCYSELKNHALALHIYRTMIKAIDDKEGIYVSNLKVKFALSLHHLGGHKEALDIFINVLNKDEDNYGALLGYSISHLDSHDYLEASKSLLRLLVNHPLSKKIKKLFAQCLKDPEAFEFVTSQIKISSSFHKIGNFLALTLKDNGLLKEAEHVFRIVVKESPFPSYYLSLSHVIESQERLYDALDILKIYLKINPDSNVCGLYNSTIYNMIRLISQKALAKGGAEIDSIFPSLPSKIKHKKLALNNQLTTDEESLLGIHITIMKLLYEVGCLHVIPSIVDILKPICDGRDFQISMIRSENMYYNFIKSLIPVKEIKLRRTLPSVHIIGDSNSLVPAWDTISYLKEERLIVPHLISSLKIWHLKSDCEYYTKKNFEIVMDSLPKKSTVIFVLGEKDCRDRKSVV